MPSRKENLAKLEYFSKFLSNSSSEILGNKSINTLIFDDEILLEIKDAILKLTKREKNIMELRFGFKTGVEKTQKEVADMLRNFSKLYIQTWKKDCP